MKSFDEMADDFVTLEASRELPNVLRVYERGRLRMAYLAGLNAGIKFCADTIEPIEEKGLGCTRYMKNGNMFRPRNGLTNGTD